MQEMSFFRNIFTCILSGIRVHRHKKQKTYQGQIDHIFFLKIETKIKTSIKSTFYNSPKTKGNRWGFDLKTM